MTRFTDAALLKGDYSHMAAEFRAGNRAAPRNKDWQKTAIDTPAEEAAQDVAKHIFALQQQIDQEKERIEILAFSAIGQFKVLGLVPGETELIRIDGILPSGAPVASLVHVEQLALTFTTAPLKKEGEDDDDGLQIGFLIFDELRERKKQKVKKAKKLSLSTSRKVKMKPAKPKKTGTTK